MSIQCPPQHDLNRKTLQTQSAHRRREHIPVAILAILRSLWRHRTGELLVFRDRKEGGQL